MYNSRRSTLLSFEGSYYCWKTNFGKRRAEYLDTLRLPEFTVICLAAVVIVMIGGDWILSYRH